MKNYKIFGINVCKGAIYIFCQNDRIEALHEDIRSLPSTYEFKLKVNINVRWLHLLKLGYLAVLAVILFLVYFTGGWNYKERGVSSIVIKVKGADFYNDTVWDAVDYVYPPQEVQAFFITTRALMTRQTQGTCTDKTNGTRCKEDSDCRQNMRSVNGVKTGECDKKKQRCLLHAWCPIEDVLSDITKITNVSGASNFTVYVRNHEEYIKFNLSRSNDYHSRKSSTNCLYNAINDPTCPIFHIGEILKESNVRFDEVKDKGGVFQFYIKWHCYFNWNSVPCLPRYYFKRIAKDSTGKFAGYNMRYAIYHESNGTRKRDLITVFGLRFLIMVKSVGEQFNFLSFVSNFGSYLSYFGIWTFMIGVLCAILLFDKKKLLTLDESAIKSIVRSRRKEDADVGDESELKSFRKDALFCEQNVALVPNC